MIVTVDLTSVPAAVTLEDPAELGRFHVAVRGAGDAAALDAVLAAAGAGRAETAPGRDLAGLDARINVVWLRDQARGQVDAGWETAFEKMLAYAASKGWLAEGGSTIQGHVESA